MQRNVITIDRYGNVSIPSDAANVWMSEAELLELFGLVAPTLRAAIRAMYKGGTLKPHEVERCIRQPDGHYADMYALSMVVALVFRINTPNAARVRNALLERLCQRKERQEVWWMPFGGKQQHIN